MVNVAIRTVVSSLQAQDADCARAVIQEYIDMIKQASDLYQKVHNLLEFRRMNRDGFRKTLKKHDKVTQITLMSTLMPEVDRKLPADQDHRLQEVLFPIDIDSKLVGLPVFTPAPCMCLPHLKAFQ